MDKEREKRIAQLLKDAAGEQSPNIGFTDQVMKQVAQLERAKEKSMYTVLQREASELAPLNFTDNVMSSLPKPIKAKPVIGRLGWAAILTGFVSIVILVLTSSGGYQKRPVVAQVESQLVDLVNRLEVAPILAVVTLALVGLAIIDRLGAKKVNKI